jgi:hypothetical protein
MCNLRELDTSSPLEWDFSPEVDPEVLHDLCEALRTVALPVMYASTSRDAILARLEQRPPPPQWEYNRPIVLALLGRHDEARTEVASRIEVLRARFPNALPDYAAFAERFERWLDTGEIDPA